MKTASSRLVAIALVGLGIMRAQAFLNPFSGRSVAPR